MAPEVKSTGVKPPDELPPVKCDPLNQNSSECRDLTPQPPQESRVDRFVREHNTAIRIVTILSLGAGFGIFGGVVAYAVDHKWGPASRRKAANDNSGAPKEDEPVTQVRSVDPRTQRLQEMAEKIKGFDAMYNIGEYDRTARAERYLKMWQESRAEGRLSFLPSSRMGNGAVDLEMPPDRWIQARATADAREIVRLAAQVKHVDPVMSDGAAFAKAGEVFEALMALPQLTREALLHWEFDEGAAGEQGAGVAPEVIGLSREKAKEGLAREGKREPRGGAAAEVEYETAMLQYSLDLERARNKEAFKAAHPEPQRSELASAYVAYDEQVRHLASELRKVWSVEPELAPTSIREGIVQNFRAETRSGYGSVHAQAEGSVTSTAWVRLAMNADPADREQLEARALQRVVQPGDIESSVTLLMDRVNHSVNKGSREALRNARWISTLPADAKEAAVTAIVEYAMDKADSSPGSSGVVLTMPEMIEAMRTRGLVVVDPETGSTAPRTTIAPPPPAAALEVTKTEQLPAFDLDADRIREKISEPDKLAAELMERGLVDGSIITQQDLAEYLSLNESIVRESIDTAIERARISGEPMPDMGKAVAESASAGIQSRMVREMRDGLGRRRPKEDPDKTKSDRDTLEMDMDEFMRREETTAVRGRGGM